MTYLFGNNETELLIGIWGGVFIFLYSFYKLTFENPNEIEDKIKSLFRSKEETEK